MFAAPHLASEGAGISYLANAKAGRWPTMQQLRGMERPKFAGDVAAFIAAQSTEEATECARRLLSNKVKKCLVCHKPNGFTLDTCNGCGGSLHDVPLSTTNNVFMGFALGIERGPFPLTVSIRHQCPRFLVMDDLLALSPLHFNVIPTTHYIPDWRFLLRQPARGAALVSEMLDCCHRACAPFLQNEEWCRAVFHPTAGAFDPADIVCGFNYPPSQYQLHIQFMLPVLMPFHHANFLKGIHYTYRRFFPAAYVQQCLARLTDADQAIPPHLLQESASIDDIIRYFDEQHGLQYDAELNLFLKKFRANSAKYAGWRPEDFGGSVVELRGTASYVEPQLNGGIAVRDVDVTSLNNQDKATLQNYGRPFGTDGKPTGSYYAHPKELGEIESW